MDIANEDKLVQRNLILVANIVFILSIKIKLPIYVTI